MAIDLVLRHTIQHVVPQAMIEKKRVVALRFNLKMLQYHPSFSGVLCTILFRDIFGDIYRVVDCSGGFGPMNPPFRDNTSHKNGDN